MSDVFISYSRKNSDFARNLIEKIREIGKDWWVDWEGIPLSSPNWWSEIKAGIENADNFVFIMSPDSMASVVCNMELDYAIALGKRIVPVVYQDVQTRDSFASIADFMPDSAMEERLAGRDPLVIARDNWQRLSHINWTFFRDSDNFDESFEKLSQAIKRDLSYVKAHTRYLNRANEWSRENKRAELLLFGGEIDVAEAWLIQAHKYTQSAKADEKEGISNPILKPIQEEYIHTSRQAQNRRRFVATAGTLTGIMSLIFAISMLLVGANATNQALMAQNDAATATFAQGEALVNAQQAEERAEIANNQLATATQALSTATAVAQNLAQAEATLEVINQQVIVAQATVTQAAIVEDIITTFANTMLQNRDNPNLRIARMNQLVARYPNEAGAYQSRGSIYAEAGRYEEAIADYDEAIRLNPQLAVLYYNRGLTYGILGEYQQEIADYDEAIRLNPQFAQAYNNRGVAYRNLGDYERAIADYDEAIRLNPQFAQAFYNRGIAYRNLEDYERAIADYDEAIRLNPQFAEAYNNRGIAYRNLEDYERAIADYDEAIRLNPEYAQAFYHRGIAHRNLEDYERAIADYDEAIRLNPEYALAYNNRAVVYYLMSRDETNDTSRHAYAQNALDDFRMAESLGLQLNDAVLNVISELEALLAQPTPTSTP